MTSTEAFFDALKSHRESQDIEISEICEFTKINKNIFKPLNLVILPYCLRYICVYSYGHTPNL